MFYRRTPHALGESLMGPDTVSGSGCVALWVQRASPVRGDYVELRQQVAHLHVPASWQAEQLGHVCLTSLASGFKRVFYGRTPSL